MKSNLILCSRVYLMWWGEVYRGWVCGGQWKHHLNKIDKFTLYKYIFEE